MRIDLATARPTGLARRVSAASWSAGGRIALTRDESIAVLGVRRSARGPRRLLRGALEPRRARGWRSPRAQPGRLLVSARRRRRSPSRAGGRGRWSSRPRAGSRGSRGPPTGASRSIASADFSSNTDKRGKRHPWPKRVASRVLHPPARREHGGPARAAARRPVAEGRRRARARPRPHAARHGAGPGPLRRDRRQHRARRDRRGGRQLAACRRLRAGRGQRRVHG